MKKYGSIYILMQIVICSFVSIGCGNRSNTESDNIVSPDADRIVYASDFLDLSEKTMVQDGCRIDDTLWFCMEPGGSPVCAVNLDTKTVTRAELSLEDPTGAIRAISGDTQGNLVLLEQQCAESESQSRYFLKVCEPNSGNLLSHADITPLLAEADAGAPGNLAVDKNNRVYLTIGKELLVMEKDGKKVTEIRPNIRWFLDLERSEEGNVVILADREDGLSIGMIDADSLAMDMQYGKLSGSGAQGRLASGEDGSLYVFYNDTVYGVDWNSQVYRKMFLWSDNGIPEKNIEYFTPWKDGFVVLLSEELEQGSRNRAAWLTTDGTESDPEKKTLVLATISKQHNKQLMEKVLYFNSISTDYRVEVQEYCTDLTSREAALQANMELMLDILSDQGPDLVDLSTLDPMQLWEKGAIENLNPYLEADAELDQTDLFPSILDSNSMDGEIYCIPSSFYIDTFYADAAEPGIWEGMTLTELKAWIEQYAGGRKAFGLDREFLLNALLTGAISEYIDWENGTCSLDSGEFAALLEFVKKYGMDRSGNGEVIPLSEVEIPIFSNDSILDPLTYKGITMDFGGQLCFIGYPVLESGSLGGVRLTGTDFFCICASSENKQGAWEFLKCFLMPEYYEACMEKNLVNMNFPSRRDVWEQMCRRLMETETVPGGDGEEVVSKYEYYSYYGKRGREPFTSEDQRILTELIENASMRSWYNAEIREIIAEEAAPFFEGQKSAQEAADVMQNRVQLYVQENGG